MKAEGISPEDIEEPLDVLLNAVWDFSFLSYEEEGTVSGVVICNA